MASQSENLWPELPKPDKGWIGILNEQANYLSASADNLLQGWVTKRSLEYSGDEIESRQIIKYFFYIRVPSLDNYLFLLFSAQQVGEKPYPLLMWPEDGILEETGKLLEKASIFIQGPIIRMNNEKDLLKTLKVIFTSQRTQTVIANILGQIRPYGSERESMPA